MGSFMPNSESLIFLIWGLYVSGRPLESFSRRSQSASNNSGNNLCHCMRSPCLVSLVTLLLFVPSLFFPSVAGSTAVVSPTQTPCCSAWGWWWGSSSSMTTFTPSGLLPRLPKLMWVKAETLSCHKAEIRLFHILFPKKAAGTKAWWDFEQTV